MPEYYIPANFEDSGKLLGIFPLRNVIEAVIVSLPIAYIVFAFVPLILTWKIILAATFIIPIGGFALIGIKRRSAVRIRAERLAMAAKPQNHRISR